MNKLKLKQFYAIETMPKYNYLDYTSILMSLFLTVIFIVEKFKLDYFIEFMLTKFEWKTTADAN